MLRDFKFLRRNSVKSDEIENVPVNPRDIPLIQPGTEPPRAPLNAIQEPRPEEEVSGRSRVEGTPAKPKRKAADPALPLRTPEKHGAAYSAKKRFGWAQKSEASSALAEGRDDGRAGYGNGGYMNMTPRSTRTLGRATSGYSESNSTQSTPTKSVNKVLNLGVRSKVVDGNGGTRGGNFAALYKGIPISTGSVTAVNTVEVPHFDLKEDSSFWMDHNVQVIIRVRPLNSMERSTQGYNRCLKQESSQCITYIGPPETRFTFDHVACETIDQETLFRMAGLPMVENCLSGYNSCMFAYGQTGSGKTYTMLGEIDDLEVKPSAHRGMTPRIFEFLFARIQAEEESRRDEKLKYYCKCSFLEIYNEQITDLLDPSSSNLLLREDITMGVYVENLSEFEVRTVSDILRLLVQGSSNRRVAATNMNRESSRSHSVFTCKIESRWEKDSTKNLRFARLNLVDLAGSERQKASGAEGERLKEAANINKSLSTLGHVIMVLVDNANGRPRHIPYRDSRLTFLLQDSLGGNSKTMIIANVSPSICCGAETLNTLKFAQRAKLIQNNAVVNEDSTGDVIALRHQIRLLQEELSILKRQNISRALSFGSTSVKDTEESACTDQQLPEELPGFEPKGTVRMSTKQLKSLETTLAGALRREQMAETSVKELEAEIEQLNRLVRQREEDTRSIKMMLRFREDKIQRMESLLSGSIPADTYLLEENRSLTEQIHLLQAKVDRNPEVTRFALENIRLLEQLRRFQEFYEEGERDILQAELSKLRDQLLQSLDGNSKQQENANLNVQPQEGAGINNENNTLRLELKNTMKELEECRCNLNSCLEENAKLQREINDVHSMLDNLRSAPYDGDDSRNTTPDLSEAPTFEDHIPMAVQNEKMNEKQLEPLLMKHDEEIMNLHLELDIIKIILNEERSSRCETEEWATRVNRDLEHTTEKLLLISKQYEDTKGELDVAKSVIEALESQQILSINQVEDMRNSNSHYAKLLSERELEIIAMKEELAIKELRDNSSSNSLEFEDFPLQSKLKRMQVSLEKAKRLNMWFQNDRAFQASNEEEMDEVRKQAEAETAEAIVCMQEELASLQQQVQDSHMKEMESKKNLTRMETELKELQESLYLITEDNKRKLEEKDGEVTKVRKQAEAETAEAIVCMQEELASLQQQVQDSHMKEMESKKNVTRMETELKELQESLYLITEDNKRLSRKLEEKGGEVTTLSEEWDILFHEIEDLLTGGQEALLDASVQLDLISSSFPHRRTWISDQVGRMIRTILEKEALIEELRRCLEDANDKRNDVECMLMTLKGATLAITEAHQQEHSEKEKEILLLMSELSSKKTSIEKLESKMKLADDHIKNASITATAAFVIVNRLSEINLNNLDALKHKDVQLSESAEMNLRKDAILNDQVAVIDLAEKQIQSLREELMESERNYTDLKQKLLEEEIRFSAMEKKLEEVEANDISDARERVAELKAGVCTLRSSVSTYVEHDKSPTREILQGDCTPVDTDARRNQDDDELRTETTECSLNVGKTVCGHSGGQKTLEPGNTSKHVDRDLTIRLLKKEIESALESLKEVQEEIAKLRNEKEEILLSEKLSQENMKCLTTQLLNLQASMSNFGKQSGLKMEALDHKLQAFTQIVKETGSDWCQTKELIEQEVGESQIVATQKTAEASCILAKFEEAQDTMKEADIMINELMIANESMKLDIERLKKVEIALISDKVTLLNEVKSLQSINDQSRREFENLEKQFGSNLLETEDLVVELEYIIAEVQATFKENFNSISCDFNCMKSLLLDSKKLVRSWLEDVWSEILVKDCAVSVLHLCHMGILLETVTGLNAENGLLQHGLCESNSVIANLREHNFKSRQELAMCRLVEGKLLADIKNSFDRISRKEKETGELSVKVTSFEKKISDLQLQEELMLQRSNYMGSQLAVLMKEFDISNSDVVVSLLNQEKFLKEKEEVLRSEAEHTMVDLCSKEFESLIFVSELEDMALRKADIEQEQTRCCAVLEILKTDLILRNVDAELNGHFLGVKEAEVALLQNELEEVQRGQQDLLLELNQKSSKLMQLDEVNKTLEEENCLLKDVANSHDVLKDELCEVMEAKVSLLNQVQVLEEEYRELLKELEMKETALEISASQISDLSQTNQKFQEEILLLETSSCKLKNELDGKNAELHRISSLEEEKRSLECEIIKLKTERVVVLQNLEEKKHVLESCKSRLDSSDMENHRLQDEMISLETRIGNLQTGMEMKNVELMGTVDMMGSKLFQLLNEDSFATVEKMFNEVLVKVEMTSNFIEELECLECHARQLISENLTLHDELLRKDEVLKGLLFDLSLLQESASISKDQKDEIEEIAASMEALEDELAAKCGELDETVAHIQVLETQLQEKADIISALELDISKERKSQELLSGENLELRAHAADALSARSSMEAELAERMKMIESLEIELSEMSNTFRLMNESVESLRSDLNELTSERDCLLVDIHSLEEKLERAEARAEENEAIAAETQQIAELRKTYAEEKEAEVKLLERSVEELECTVNVLENKVDIIKGEAERQRLQREDLELELLGLKHQIQNVNCADAEMKRHLEERENDLQEAMKRVKVLEKDMIDREAEITKLKAHISELNLHAEAQASEYKQKFKALEAMAEQVKPDCPSTQISNSLSNKSEKNATRPRGSGSPFKCIGLGLVQQMKSEKDEDLTAARLRIQELESLAVSRQKEIFSLNARLAAAESMTHDVIRDLLGLKLDMSNYASLLDNQQVQKIAENARLHNLDSEEQDVIKLKQQLNELIKDRTGWLEESDRRQAELVAAQITLEKLRQQEQLLKTENDMLKIESINHKKRVMEFEEEIKKLSGQQNLQQRIHHHAKIKEENNTLKLQNDDLKARVHRAEMNLTRVKEELARHRAAMGRNPRFSFGEDQSLNNKLKKNQLSLSPPRSSRTDENCPNPRRASHAPFFSSLDR